MHSKKHDLKIKEKYIYNNDNKKIVSLYVLNIIDTILSVST